MGNWHRQQRSDHSLSHAVQCFGGKGAWAHACLQDRMRSSASRANSGDTPLRLPANPPSCSPCSVPAASFGDWLPDAALARAGKPAAAAGVAGVGGLRADASAPSGTTMLATPDPDRLSARGGGRSMLPRASLPRKCIFTALAGDRGGSVRAAAWRTAATASAVALMALTWATSLCGRPRSVRKAPSRSTSSNASCEELQLN